MRVRFVMPLCLLLWSPVSHAQILGVIGSSTAAGYESSAPDSAWVIRTAKYYISRGQLSAVIDLAVSGYTSFKGMPDSYALQDPPQTPDSTHNISQILRLGSDVVVIAFPSNDISAGFTLTQYLSNLRTMYDSVTVLGKRCYVTTTQPREDIDPGSRLLLKQGRDSILAEFGAWTLNFWDSVTDPVSLGILPQYSAGDGIHFNDAGHAVLARIADSAAIMTSVPLPLVFTAFTAQWQQQDALIKWSLANRGIRGGTAQLYVERSGDGKNFSTVYQTSITGNPEDPSSFTDDHCPEGTNYYRLRLDQDTKEIFSQVDVLAVSAPDLYIGKVYVSTGNASLTADLHLPAPGKVSMKIISLSGTTAINKNYSFPAGSNTLSVPLNGLAAGEYILFISAGNGHQVTKQFIKF